MSLPHSIRIVLMGPKHAGNIGACARAIKNMGFSDLRLVSPEASHLAAEALDRSVKAQDVLKKAKLYATLPEALASCDFVVGTSGKLKDIRIATQDPRELAQTIKAFKKPRSIALVFGPEDRGLSNEELLLCDAVVEIPSSEEFSSLNLSHALVVVLYELRMMFLGAKPSLKKKLSPVEEKEAQSATVKSKEGLYAHLQEALLHIDFLHPQNPNHIMRDLRNIFNRAGLLNREVTILRGICRRILRPSGWKKLKGEE
ncbi:RNA methyltransferase [bacterium]|nr:RNA methyltransferase [bacterium]